MNSRRIVLCGVCLLQNIALGVTAETAPPLLLKTPEMEVGMLPRVGGRIVLLRIPGGDNVLLSDPKLWNESEEDIPAPLDIEKNPWLFKAYNGHIIWVGPQIEWYNRQTLLPNKKGAAWPPDPFLEYGGFSVTDQSERRIVLQGPESPISGMALTKMVEIAADGEVKLTTMARNIRREPIAWDLWSNTRVSPLLYVYAPLKSKLRIEMDIGPDFDNQPFAYSIENSFFIVANRCQPVAAPFKRRVGKAFLDVRSGYVAAFSESFCLLKRFPLVPSERLHPTQANVEIYYAIEAGKESEGLMELENHGPYTEIAPRGTLEMQESLLLLPYQGEATTAGHIAFLKSLGLEAEK